MVEHEFLCPPVVGGEVGFADVGEFDHGDSAPGLRRQQGRRVWVVVMVSCAARGGWRYW